VPAGAASSSSGSPISVLKLAREAATVRRGATSAAMRSFEGAPPAARQRAERRDGVVGREDGAAGERPRPPRRREHAPRPGPQGVGGEPAAVHPLAGDGDEQIARGDRARVDDDPRRAALALAQEFGAGRAGDLLGGPVLHALATARNASRATTTSSKGSLRPPANSWPCSCPLPAMTTTSPAAASAIAAAIAARRSSTRFT
jgi:hypothetical protein